MTDQRRFSLRSGFERQPNRLAQVLEQVRRSGRAVCDLTESNPTAVGLGVPVELLAGLGAPSVGRYQPTPFGRASSRRAVAAYHRSRGQPVRADQVLLTASSSEGYGWLFKLLLDPGDELLVPTPSYPLLPLLAQLESVALRSYSLCREEGWRVDVDAVRRAMTDRTKAVVVVHPNNPTGSLVARSDAAALVEICRARRVALVVDEVFADYRHGPVRDDRLPSFLEVDRCLCFVLSGLSKLALAPQLKLGWIVAVGPEAARREALARLELIADCYLSVGTPVQQVLPALLAGVDQLQHPVHERLRRNVAAIDAAVARQGPTSPVRRLPSEAGWYGMLEIPRTRSDDEWVERLALKEALVAHPGYFFDLEQPGTMVVSLLLEPERFAPAIERAIRLWSAG